MLTDVKSMTPVAGVLVLLLFGGAQHIRAQSQDDTWRSIGPDLPSSSTFYAATRQLMIDQQTPTTIYVGTRAGVFKSIDAGGQWFAINAGLGGHPIIDALAIDPQNPAVLYAGISVFYEFEPSGFGVYKTDDGGTSWHAASAGLGNRYILSLAIDPQTPSTVYAIADGPYYLCCTGVIFKSVDGGTNWAQLADFRTNVMLIDPKVPTTIYAGGNGGILKSTDGGETWTAAGSGLNQVPQVLAADPLTSGIVYAGTYGAGVFKSTDGGGSWAPVNSGLTNLSITTLTIDPATPSIVYAGTNQGGVFKSNDGGGSWINAGIPDVGINGLAVDPQTPANLYASASQDGVFKSSDDGRHWSAANAGISNTRVYSLAIDAQPTATIYAGSYRGQGLFAKSIDSSGTTWNILKGLTGVITTVVVDAQNPSTLYAINDISFGTVAGFLYKSTDGGGSWSLACQCRFGFQKLAIDPLNPSVLYAASYSPSSVWKTVDGGTSWSQTELNKPASALAVDPQSPSTVYAGTYSDGVFKTSDGGASWVAMNDGLTTLAVTALAIDPQTTTTLYAVAQGDGLFKSSDGGSHWTAAGAGLPEVYIYTLAVDPQIPSILYAGTYGAGVFTSSDAGVTWNALSDGLTNLYVRALALDPREPTNVYAGTDGTGVFALTRPPHAALTVIKAGDGRGTVTSTPGGVDCGGDCAEWYANGATVVLRAVAAADSVFTGWRDCDAVGEDGTCTVTMDRSRTVTAGFDLRRFTLRVAPSRTGGGTVVSSPGGIDCGSDCSEVFVIGTTVTLTATPEHGVVKEWSGCDTDTGHGRVSTCRVTMTGDRAVTATFTGPPSRD